MTENGTIAAIRRVDAQSPDDGYGDRVQAQIAQQSLMPTRAADAMIEAAKEDIKARRAQLEVLIANRAVKIGDINDAAARDIESMKTQIERCHAEIARLGAAMDAREIRRDNDEDLAARAHDQEITALRRIIEVQEDVITSLVAVLPRS